MSHVPFNAFFCELLRALTSLKQEGVKGDLTFSVFNSTNQMLCAFWND
jgi:hypothetical protein